MPSQLLPALGTAFGGAAAGSAAAATAGSQIFGSMIAGLGTSLMERSAERRAEERQIEEERRREARYDGSGDAATINPMDNAEEATSATKLTQQRVRGQKDPSTPLGFNDTTNLVGSKPPGPKRHVYDPKSGKIEFS